MTWNHSHHRSTPSRGARAIGSLLLAFVTLPVFHGDSFTRADEPTIDFLKDIRPLLSNSCFRCHGPDESTREGNLRLDLQDATLAGGDSGPAIVPGDLDNSELWRRIITDDPSEQMPPPDTTPRLSSTQQQLLAAWIESGARYETHWAWRPLVNPTIPDLPGDFIANGPIDRFLDAELLQRGIPISPSADPATRLRRLSLDLLGLPPDPEDLAAFIADQRPDAWQRVVDRTLASPHFGERWGRHWLDQARYADTHGYSVDGERTQWPYRDWVITAHNQDLSFDRFTLLQLAGDLLPNPDLDALVATGFHRNTLINQEGGVDGEQFRVESVIDRTNTTGAVWLGLTFACAQCHHHKYDPISQQDYYQLYAFFDSTRDVNDVGPTIPVPTPAQQQELDAARARLDQAQRLLAERQATQPAPTSNDANASDEHFVVLAGKGTATSDAGAQFERQNDGSWLVSGTIGERDNYRLSYSLPTDIDRITAVRLEAIPDPSLPAGGPGRASNGNFVLSEIQLAVNDQATPFATAWADHSQPKYPIGDAIDQRSETGWAINLADDAPPGQTLNVHRTAIFALAQSLEITAPSTLTLQLQFADPPARYPLGRFRLAISSTPATELGLPDPLLVAAERLVTQQRQAYDELSRSIPRSMILAETETPRDSRILIRGDFLRRGEPVQPSVPKWIPGSLPDDAVDHRKSRVDLAAWLVAPDQPLTPRVIVNRWWMHLFGTGLVETENDFGSQGALPSHPELLDYLAITLRDEGWSMKQVLRKILTSATYQRSSVVTSATLSLDPINRYLGRQNRLRVEGEIVRDLTLAVSDALHRRIGGPPVRPPQPEGIDAFTQNRSPWPTSTGGDRRRRGMYTFFRRSVPYPLLTTFDAPKFETTCTRRIRSNTPLQALTIANDPAFLESARSFGLHLLRTGSDDESRIDLAYQLAFSRPPTAQERRIVISLIHAERVDFQSDPALLDAWLTVAPGEAAYSVAETERIEWGVWTGVARLLFNLDEFITRE